MTKEINREDMEGAMKSYLDGLAKPVGSMGRLEDMAVKLSGIYMEKPEEIRKAVVIFAGDTAVDGVNETKGKLSYNEAALVSQGYGPVNVAAREIKAPVFLIDVGLERNTDSIPGILNKKVIHGTHHGYPAMDKELVEQAISTGMSVAATLGHQGINAVGIGHIGERSMLSALSVTAAVLKKDLEKASRKSGYHLKLASLGSIEEDPIGVLAAVGSAEIAALFGFTVEAMRQHMAVVFDDGVTGAAVLAAAAVYPDVRNFVFPSLIYKEPVHEMQMKALGMKGMIDLGITGGAGIGSVMGLSLLDAAADMVTKMKSLKETGVSESRDISQKGVMK